MLKGKMTKLESRTQMCLSIGYPKGMKGYYFYNSEEQNVFVSKNAKLLEEDYTKDYKPKSKIELKELSQDDISPSFDDRIEKALRKEKSHNDQQPLEPRHSGRMIKKFDRYFRLGESYDSVSDNQQNDPFTYWKQWKMLIEIVSKRQWNLR